ncbi:ATP-binding protein [Streptomyces spongiae]|uniref:ATP-binding protein n=1 Tax=Streptomyces spongiae TaxID=565072 RepID=UPI001884382F|nr:ATP-binding protein [Streptomyces spongiae]
MPEYTLRCPRLDTSPRIARDFVSAVLRTLQLDAVADDAALCSSELVTNSCVHAEGAGAVLQLAVDGVAVRVTIYDDDPALPVLREGYDGESGRGLWIVDALTEGRWGIEPGIGMGLGRDGGKGVWFELGGGAAGRGTCLAESTPSPGRVSSYAATLARSDCGHGVPARRERGNKG